MLCLRDQRKLGEIVPGHQETRVRLGPQIAASSTRKRKDAVRFHHREQLRLLTPEWKVRVGLLFFVSVQAA